MLFYLRRQEDVAAVIREHGRMCDAEGLLIGACRDMNDVHVRLECHRDANTLIQIVSALAELGAAHAQLNREERSHCLTHSLQHFNRETAAVLEGSAVLILPVIEQRREELV